MADSGLWAGARQAFEATWMSPALPSRELLVEALWAKFKAAKTAELWARVALGQVVNGPGGARLERRAGEFVMTGGLWGEHRLSADPSITDGRRLVEHWTGYCEAVLEGQALASELAPSRPTPRRGA